MRSATAAVDEQLCAGHRLQFLDAHARQFFAQHEAPVLDVDDGEARIDARDAADAGQRQGALLHQLRLAVLGDVVGDDGDRLAPCTRSMAPPTAGTPLGPVRQLARSPFSATS